MSEYFTTKEYPAAEIEKSEKQVYLEWIIEKTKAHQSKLEMLKNYYADLEYEVLLEFEAADNVIIDSVEYNVYKENWCYILSAKDYSNFQSDAISNDIFDIEDMLGNFQGVYIGVNKKTYEIEYLKINISRYDMGLGIELIWDVNKIDEEHQNLEFSITQEWGLDVGYML